MVIFSFARWMTCHEITANQICKKKTQGGKPYHRAHERGVKLVGATVRSRKGLILRRWTRLFLLAVVISFVVAETLQCSSVYLTKPRVRLGYI